MTAPEALPLPPLLAHNTEIARVWLCGDEDSGRSLRVTLRSSVFSDPERPEHGAVTWGIALADIARHVADAISSQHGVDEGVALANIARVFAAEIGSPTFDDRGTEPLDGSQEPEVP